MKYSDYNRIYQRAMSIASNVDGSLTLKSFQRRTSQIRAALQLAHKEYAADIAEIDKTYTPAVAEPKKAALTEEYKALTKIAKERALDDLSKTIAAKRAQFSETFAAPDEESMRLLQALSMRQTLTAGEVAETASRLNRNYHTSKILAEIAARFDIPFPAIADQERIETALNDAEQYAQRMIEYIDVTDDKMLNYSAVSFYKYPDTRTEADAYFDRLDGDFFTAAQVGTDEAAEQAETAKQAAGKPTDKSGEMWAQVTLTGREMLYAIANQFHVNSADIRAANPGVNLNNLCCGQKIYIPSTRYSFTPDPNGAHVQADQEVRLVPKPTFEPLRGPGGVEVGDDIIVK